MTGGSKILDQIRAAVGPHGIFVRGVVDFADSANGPYLANGRPAQSLVLLGNIGGSLWDPFVQWRRGRADAGGSDPLDTWSKAVIRPIADDLAATAWFPSDPPWQPFQQWAMMAEGLKASPLGILIHPRFGLWHGYRAALGFACIVRREREDVASLHPCDSCADKPCLSSCPAEAISSMTFDVGKCRAHLATAEGQTGCIAAGCMARPP